MELDAGDYRRGGLSLAQVNKVHHVHTIARVAAMLGEVAASARDGTGEADNRRLKASVVRLQETVVQFNCLNSDGNKIWRSVQLLGQSDLEEATGQLTYTFPPGIEERRLSIAIYRCAQSTSLNRNTD